MVCLRQTYREESKRSILANSHKYGARVDFYATEDEAYQVVYKQMIKDEVFDLLIEDEPIGNWHESVSEEYHANYEANRIEQNKRFIQYWELKDPTTDMIKTMYNDVMGIINTESWDLKVGPVVVGEDEDEEDEDE